MTDVTRILSAIEQGDPHAAEQLLPLVYDELRKLAAQRLAQEKPGQTLQATALVHEAYCGLWMWTRRRRWNSRGHFFAAAAEAMRRILVERARRKHEPGTAAGARRQELRGAIPDRRRAARRDIWPSTRHLTSWSDTTPRRPTLVKLRYFAGLTMHQDAAASAGPSPPGSRSLVAAGPHLAVPGVWRDGRTVTLHRILRAVAASICRTGG